MDIRRFRNTFGRQAIPMTWDFAEGNLFSKSTGNFVSQLVWIEKFLASTSVTVSGCSVQTDASSQAVAIDKIVSTDPPYYDNVGYADLSDFFYVWLRRTVRSTYPDLFATLGVPKAEELVATPYRHGNRKQAESFFLAGMTEAMRRLAEQTHTGFRNDLLRLQAVRNQRRCGYIQHRLGDVLGRRYSRRVRGHGHLADADRAFQDRMVGIGTQTPSPPASSLSAASALRGRPWPPVASS